MRLGESTVYSYIGSGVVKAVGWDAAERTLVSGTADVLAWGDSTKSARRSSTFVATFVVDVNGSLWIADRHSEHVACARGRDVLSAGEMTVEVDDGDVCVTDITNQSTGYCPEPESWPAVAAALDKAGIPHPDGFTRAFLFRLCEACGQTNIVKEGEFTCAVCGAELEPEWNFSHDTRQR